MIGRHSPPTPAEAYAVEKQKRPKKRGRTAGPQEMQRLLQWEMELLPLTTDPEQTPHPPETLSAPALPLPSSNPQPSDNDDKPATASSSSDPKPGASSPGSIIVVDGVEFHHESEAEFARLLSYYGIDWQYEPNQFPVQWRDGRPIEMFTPDFYLTEYDLYIELTTMRQSLVRRKNRKLRLLRALYPEINIKLLYRRDYQRLLERFGIDPREVEAEHTGTPETLTEE